MPAFLKKTINICKRIFRYFFYLILILVTLMILAFFSVRFFFPTEKLKKVAISTFERTFPRRLAIGDVNLNVFKGFEFNDIQIDPISDSIDAFPIKRAKIKKVIFQYDFAKILKRQFFIHEILVSTPQFELAMDATRPAELDTVKKIPSPPLDSLLRQVIPVSIKLSRFRIKDAEIKFLLADLKFCQRFYLEDIDLSADGLRIPRGVLSDQDSLLAGTIHLGCKDSRLSFAQMTDGMNDLDVSTKMDLDVNVQIGRLNDLHLSANVQLNKTIVQTTGIKPVQINFPIFLSLESRADLVKQHVVIQPAEVKVDNVEWLKLHADISNLLTQPSVEIGVDRGEIPINQLYQLAQETMPDSLIPKLYFDNYKSAIRLLNTRIWGVLPDSTAQGELNFSCQIRLDDFGASMNDGQMGIDGFLLSTNIRGQVGFNKVHNLKITTTAAYDSVFYYISDTLAIYTGKGDFSSELDLNEKFLPTVISTRLSIDNILGSKLVGDISLSGSESLRKIKGLASFGLTDIDFDRIMPSPVSTTASLDFKVKINSLDSIALSSHFKTDLLTVTMVDEEQEVLPALHLKIEAECRSDTLFQDIDINSISAALNDIFDMKASASVREGGKESFEVTISRLQINHKAIFAWIPGRIMEQMEGLQIDGCTTMSGKLTGKLTSTLPQYNASADVATEKMNIVYPNPPLSVKGINLDIHAETVSDQMTFVDFSIQIDSTRTDNLKEMIFLDNRINFLMTSRDFQSLQIRNGRIQLPTLFTFGDFQAGVDNLRLDPKIDATLHLNQAIKDSLQIFPELILSGMTEMTVDVQMDTSLLDLAAFVRSTELNINMPDQLKVKNIDADIKLHQRVNLHDLTFQGREANPIQTPSGSSLDYLLYRSFYHSSLPDLSHLKIDKIQVANYIIDTLRVEMFLGDGLLEIPSFICQLYGGNLGGEMWLNMAGGDLAQARYQLWSHFSGINSALMIQGSTGNERKGIINGNFNFQGKGLDPDKKIDLEGFFNITEIEPKVADNLLRSLDPQGLDPGIKSTRALINHGFKPKLMSFRLQHGYFYPSIPLSQPWYFPLRISGGNIELNRLPVEFILERAKQFSAVAQ